MHKTKEWLILNAVHTWLYHYEKQDEAAALTPQYQQLHRELYDAYITNDTPVQKRGRPAKRQRTKKAASNSASKEKVETP